MVVCTLRTQNPTPFDIIPVIRIHLVICLSAAVAAAAAADATVVLNSTMIDTVKRRNIIASRHFSHQLDCSVVASLRVGESRVN